MKRNFETVEQGTTYNLPKYKVVDKKGIETVILNYSPYIDINGNKIAEGHIVKGLVDNQGQSEVFFKYGVWQPFDYLENFDGSQFAIIGFNEQVLYQTITFVRGDKTDNGTIIPRVDGILHEQLLAMMIEDMKYKNSLVPDRNTNIAITHLEDALFRLEERARDREIRNVQGTYTK